MKLLPILLTILIAFSCNRDTDPPNGATGENISFTIEPSITNSNYPLSDKEHYVVRNDELHVDKLMLFIGGSFSTPKNYNRICDYVAFLGYDVISLSYANSVATAPLGASSDPLVFDKYRDEICFGNAVSSEVDVDPLNSINTRLINLLQFLHDEYPDQNWDQYLTTSNTIRWEKVIVSGHSQGSGHACYLAKQNNVDKVVMFSGPNDYSTYFNEPANWLSEEGETSLDRHYSLLHIQDEVVSFNNQVNNLRSLGLLTENAVPILVDELESPYSNANALSINISSFSEHSSTIGSNAILPEIWTYMFAND